MTAHLRAARLRGRGRALPDLAAPRARSPRSGRSVRRATRGCSPASTAMEAEGARDRMARSVASGWMGPRPVASTPGPPAGRSPPRPRARPAGRVIAWPGARHQAQPYRTLPDDPSRHRQVGADPRRVHRGHHRARAPDTARRVEGRIVDGPSAVGLTRSRSGAGIARSCRAVSRSCGATRRCGWRSPFRGADPMARTARLPGADLNGARARKPRGWIALSCAVLLAGCTTMEGAGATPARCPAAPGSADHRDACVGPVRLAGAIRETLARSHGLRRWARSRFLSIGVQCVVFEAPEIARSRT